MNTGVSRSKFLRVGERAPAVRFVLRNYAVRSEKAKRFVLRIINSRLEKGSTEKDKYGYLERENGVYYFKLNLKIGLLKR